MLVVSLRIVYGFRSELNANLSLTIRGGHGGLRYCGIGLFFMRYFSNLILTYGIAVSSSSAVCGFSSFWLTVFGEIRLFTVLRYCLFALSFRYNTQNKTQ